MKGHLLCFKIFYYIIGHNIKKVNEKFLIIQKNPIKKHGLYKHVKYMIEYN